MSIRQRLAALERRAPPGPQRIADLGAAVAAALTLPTEHDRCTELLRLHRLFLMRSSPTGPSLEMERGLRRLPVARLRLLHRKTLGLSEDGPPLKPGSMGH